MLALPFCAIAGFLIVGLGATGWASEESANRAGQVGLFVGVFAESTVVGQLSRPSGHGWVRGLAVLGFVGMATWATAWTPVEPVLGELAPVCAACAAGALGGAGLLAWPPHEG